MTTFSEDLKVIVDEILGANRLRQEQAESGKRLGQFDLYHAQGARLKAQDNLKTAKKRFKMARLINSQGIENSGIAADLAGNTAGLASDVEASISEAASAAADAQVAATTIAKLASDIAAAFNIVSAADYGSDIYDMAKSVNERLQRTAYQAEYVSQLAMEASGETAEMTSSEILKEAREVNSQIGGILKSTTADLDRIGKARNRYRQALAAACQQERTAQGDLAFLIAKYEAATSSLESNSQLLNYSLAASSPPSSDKGFSVRVSFEAYKFPFSRKEQESERGTADSAQTFGPIQYYAVIVKAENASKFSLRRAEDNFVDHKNRYYPVNPSTHKAPFNSLSQTSKRTLLDSDGHEVTLGTTYVVFLYIELPQDFKKSMGNFNDLLSAPSSKFTPRDLLPAPNDFDLKKDSKGNVESLSFIMSDVPLGTEYRCIFVAAHTDHLGIDFNLPLAEQLSAGQYTQAMRQDKAQAGEAEYQVKLLASTADNFGNLLAKGETYFVIILASMQADNIHYARYQNAISDPTAHPICLHAAKSTK